MGTGGQRSRQRWVLWQVVTLMAMPVVLVLLNRATGVWEWLLHSQVPHSDSDAVGLVVLSLVGLAAGFVVWCLTWLVPRGQLRTAALLITVLVAPGVVHSVALTEALRFTPARLAAHAQQQASREADATADAAEHERRAAAWVASLPKADSAHGPLFPARAANGHLVWDGHDYGAVSWFGPKIPVLTAQPLLRVKGGRALVVQHYDSQNMSQKSTVSVLGPGGETQDLVHAHLGGVAVSPDGALVAYSQRIYPADRSTDRPFSEVVFKDGTGRVVGKAPIGFTGTVVGWNASGLIAVDRQKQLLVYGSTGGQPRTLGTADSRILVATDSDRVLEMSCDVTQDATAWASYDNAWVQGAPPTYPLALGVATATPGCVGDEAARVLSTSGPVRQVWSGDHPLTISPDGRYVVDDTLTAVDVATGRRTPLSAAFATAFIRDTPKSRERWAAVGTPLITGFWHDARTVEVTRQGAPLALCTLPEGPCRRFT